MGATTITVSHKARPFRFPRCGFRSLCCGFWLVPFCQIRRHQGNGQPLEERKASRQGRSHQWKQQPSQNHNNNHQSNGNPFRHPWTLSAMTTDQGQRRCGNGSNNHHRATRQERCDSLVAIPFPLLRLLARSLSESSRSNQGKDVAAMGAIDITGAQGQPSEERTRQRDARQPRQSRSHQWKQPTSENHKGNGNCQRNGHPFAIAIVF